MALPWYSPPTTIYYNQSRTSDAPLVSFGPNQIPNSLNRLGDFRVETLDCGHSLLKAVGFVREGGARHSKTAFRLRTCHRYCTLSGTSFCELSTYPCWILRAQRRNCDTSYFAFGISLSVKLQGTQMQVKSTRAFSLPLCSPSATRVIPTIEDAAAAARLRCWASSMSTTTSTRSCGYDPV